MDYPTGLTPGEPPNLLKPRPYQGPPGAKPPPPGYTFYTQRAVLQGKTGVKDFVGREEKFWRVTVYYTNVDDPYAPLEPVTTEYVRSYEDLSKRWEHPCIYDKVTPGSPGPGSVRVERVSEQVTGEIDQRKAASVEDENRIRALARKQRQEKELWRQEKSRELKARQDAEIAHADLIEEHRELFRQRQKEIRCAEAIHREEIERARERYRQRLRKERERALQKERRAQEAARAEELEKAAQLETEMSERLKGEISVEEEELEDVAAGLRDVAKTYIENSTEPKHLGEAIEMLGKTQSFSSKDDQAILEAASAKQAEFIEDTIEKILTRPHDASIEDHKEDLNELGDRIKLYQQLPGADEVVEERALTKFYRQAQEIRELEARKASRALQGKTQIDDRNRGLDIGSRGTRR